MMKGGCLLAGGGVKCLLCFLVDMGIGVDVQVGSDRCRGMVNVMSDRYREAMSIVK